MREKRSGLLLHISSGLGPIALPFFGLYLATKFGLEGMAASLRYEVRRLGIDSVILEPGPFSTNLLAGGPRPADEKRVREYGEVGAKTEQFEGALQGMYQDESTPTDPNMVAGKMVEIIETPAGQRLARKSVGVDIAPGLNDAIAPFAKAALEALGLADMDKLGS